MELISLNEKRTIQLEMLEEVDEFCRKNDILYSLSCGTLLGAIRHKGFIPWDDDLDIMMPLPSLLKFKNSFSSNNCIYADVDTISHYEFGFSRIVHKQSFSKVGVFSKSYGINIDLYPITSLPNSISEQDEYFKKGQAMLQKRLKLIKRRQSLIHYFPFNNIPIFDNVFDKSIKQFTDYILYDGPAYGSTNKYFVWSGPITIPQEVTRCIYSCDLFKEVKDIVFENKTFMSIAEYHHYLTQTYGNYMELPPEEERVPCHGGDYYRKNNTSVH